MCVYGLMNGSKWSTPFLTHLFRFTTFYYCVHIIEELHVKKSFILAANLHTVQRNQSGNEKLRGQMSEIPAHYSFLNLEMYLAWR